MLLCRGGDYGGQERAFDGVDSHVEGTTVLEPCTGRERRCAAECQDKSSPLGSPRPRTGGLCDPQSLSSNNIDPQDRRQGSALVGGCTLQIQAELGHKASHVPGKPRPHTHRVGASQGRSSPLWLTPVLQGRSGCAAQGHPECGEHSWLAWKSPAQAVTFSLHSCHPQRPAGPARVRPADRPQQGLSPLRPKPLAWPCSHHRLTPDLSAAELSTA